MRRHVFAASSARLKVKPTNVVRVTRFLGPAGAMAHGRDRGRDRVGGAQRHPVTGREGEGGEQGLPGRRESLGRLGVFGCTAVNEGLEGVHGLATGRCHPNRLQIRRRFAAQRLGSSMEHGAPLLEPAARRRGFGIDRIEPAPPPQRPVPDRPRGPTVRPWRLEVGSTASQDSADSRLPARSWSRGSSGSRV
jgi:hypothetical protein